MERLKQKVASSRVFASLQQVAATGSGQQQQQQAGPSQQDHQVSRARAGPDAPAAVVPEAAMSTAWLMAADATSHLTEEEKDILLQVFKKEEQFQRDTIKQLTASRAQQQQHQLQGASKQAGANKENQQRLFTSATRRQYNKNNQSTTSMCSSAGTAINSISSATPTSSNQSSRPCSCATSACGHATPSTLTNTPVSSNVAGDAQTMASNRAQSRGSTMSLASGRQTDPRSGVSDQSPAPAASNVGQCRICRKTIEPSEPCHLCSNCNQFVCDDCASYSASDQFWMCSSCRRRALNPAIPAEALKELGLNQNSSAVRRMTLRLNQNELKMAANKFSSEPVTSNQSPASAQTSAGAQQRPQPLSVQQQQQLQQQRLRRQSSARRTTSDGDSSEPVAESRRSAAAPPLNRQNSLGPQQQPQTGRRPSSSANAQTPTASQRLARGPKQQPANPTSAGARSAQQQAAASPAESSLARSPSRQRCKSGGEPLKRVNSVQQQRQGAQKTLSQPSPQQPQPQQAGQPRTGSGQPKWPEPEVKRVPSSAQAQRRDSLRMQLDQRIEQSLQSMVQTPDSAQQWHGQPASAPQTGHSYMDASYGAGNDERHFEPATQAGEQFVRSLVLGHKNSLAFGETPFQQQQQQQVFGGASMSGSATQLASSVGSSRRSSYNQHAGAYMSQLIPVPPEQMHLRRLSDQSNLVRRSSIIASNLFDGTTIARNRSHSNIDSVHYLQQAMGSRQQVNDPSLAYANIPAWQSARRQSRDVGGGRLEVGQLEVGSSSATNLHYLQPNQQQQQEQLQQRRLSDGCQYFGADQQQIASIVTSYAQKQQSRRHRNQSSDEAHSDSSSDLDHGPPMRPAGDGYSQSANQDEAYAYQQQITIPSVSVSEFAAAAAARRRSSVAQQQQLSDEIMAGYQQDNRITPMQINVAIEQVIQQQQQEQLAPSQNQDAPFLYMTRRASSGRVLPSIPGGQSRSLLELPLNGGPANGQAQQGAAGLDGSRLSNGHTRNNSTAGLGHTLDLPCLSPTIRRASAPEGQIIKIVVDDMDSSLPFGGRHPQNGMKQRQFEQCLQAGNLYERHILYRDDSLDPSGNHVGRGFGLQVMGGKLDRGGKLQACVKWVLQGGPADKVGIRAGDKLVEWDGKCLVDMSYEQVAEVIESSANIAEVLVKPKPQRVYDPHQPPANYVRSQRRLSQQTEKDLRRHHQAPVASGGQLSRHARRMSSAVQASSEFSRMGTGRRLPQIPPAMQAGEASLGVPLPIRHGSTGQLDQSAVQMLNSMATSQAGNSQYLGTYHLNAEQQLQSRSAGELHRGSVAGLNYGPAPMSSENGMVTLSTGSWMQSQYGGSQQMIPGTNAYAASNDRGYALNNSHEFSGLIGLQVNVDERLATLEISILSAHNIERDPSLDYVVKVRILPENNRFKICTTQPSSDMNWKETFLFQNFPIHQVQKMAFEIGIWVHDEAPMLSAHIEQPLCEALIPIQSARERNIDFWPLRPPPTSPQARRKSLNDLMGNHHQGQKGSEPNARVMTANHKTWTTKPSQEMFPPTLKSSGNDKLGSFGSLVRISNASLIDDQNIFHQRERSSSIRHLPDSNKSQMQPRRASDEVAMSSSHRLLARLSPAVSRRSISVMNVGDGYSGRASRSPVSRLGSQANILKVIQMRRDSSQIQ